MIVPRDFPKSTDMTRRMSCRLEHPRTGSAQAPPRLPVERTLAHMSLGRGFLHSQGHDPKTSHSL
jgi:hypothetical protein